MRGHMREHSMTGISRTFPHTITSMTVTQPTRRHRTAGGCWHVGINYGGKNLFQQYGNKNSIGVEMCVQAGYNYEKAFENTAALVREIMRETGIPLERVYRHYDICSKYCPSQIMNRGDWDRMKRMIGSGAGSTGSLGNAIERGLKEVAVESVTALLKEKEALDVINEEIIPALDHVGKGFEKGTVFLPQLLMSAEAAKAAFEVIKNAMAGSGETQEKKGTIILATVKGDIHDIGKNIVKVLLENYSYDVIDLGKDVPPETVVEEAVSRHVPLVGLSALMTTTVPSMEETIKQLRESAPWVKVMVGGAVLTQEYADTIGADAYCKDAMASVHYAETVI